MEPLILQRPNPRQEEFLRCRAKYIAFGGARGGGKSWAVRTKAKLLALRYPGIRQLLVRRTYQELENNHIRFLRRELADIAEYRAAGRQFLSLFTADAAVVEAGLVRLWIIAPAFVISPFMDGSIAAARGLGKTRGATVIVILSSCVFRIVWIYTVFVWVGTYSSLLMLYPVSWTITGIAATWYFFRVYREAAAHME